MSLENQLHGNDVCYFGILQTIVQKREAEMNQRISLNLFVLLAAALAFGMVILAILQADSSLQDVVRGLFALSIYGILFASYLARFALVFYGVYALYKVIRQRVNG
jgi:glucan phosphoethanolaminetransferase (alkaline phosphatase superfamily)